MLAFVVEIETCFFRYCVLCIVSVMRLMDFAYTKKT